MLLVFVDVRSRFDKKFGELEKEITLYKNATEGNLRQSPSDTEISFDIISIVIAQDEPQIQYFTDAF